MAKTSKRPSTRTLSPSALRAKIERLDRALFRLVQQRAGLVQAATTQEAGTAMDALPTQQEDDLIEELVAGNQGPLPERSLRAVYREVLGGCKALVRPVRVAFLGPLFSYSHLAAVDRFGQEVELVPVGTIGAVFEEVYRGQSDFGLAPIENSTDGRIADTLDMLTRLPLRICGDVSLRIHHALLGRCQRSEIQEVYSRPQALSQCRNWLARHLPDAKLVEVSSTAAAAQLACEKPNSAAIAGVQAGVRYGLTIMAEKIEDNPENITRFAVIGNHSAPRTGRDKTALWFQAEHRPGSLAEAMNIFKRARLNLTWIESFPVPESSRTYLFFVELEGHETDTRVRKTLAILQRRTLRMQVLGSYPITSPVE